jgi:hypothetical protein
VTSVRITPLSTIEATQKDPRHENFVQAYLDMGYNDDDAQRCGFERFWEDEKARFNLWACTNFRTAKETIYLLEAASMLCCGSLGDAEAVRLIRMALDNLEANR